MTAPHLKLTQPQPSPACQRLAAARRAHADAINQLVAVSAGRQRLEQAEADERGITREIAAVADREAAELAEWASHGRGERPAPHTAERKALEERRAAAQATATAARALVPQFDGQARDAQARGCAARSELDVAIMAVLEEEHAPLMRELAELSDRRRKLLARVLALPHALSAMGRVHLSTDSDGAMSFLRAAERLNAGATIPMADPSAVELDAAAQKWGDAFKRLEVDPNAEVER